MKKSVIILLFAAVSTITLTLTGCKPIERIVEHEKVVYKTEYKNTVQRDSIYLQDSIYIHQRGDTVFVNKWKTAYKYKILTDTVRTADSVYTEVPYLVEVPKVEYRQTAWQKFMSKVGLLSLIIAACTVGWKLIKMKFKL